MNYESDGRLSEVQEPIKCKNCLSELDTDEHSDWMQLHIMSRDENGVLQVLEAQFCGIACVIHDLTTMWSLVQQKNETTIQQLEGMSSLQGMALAHAMKPEEAKELRRRVKELEALVRHLQMSSGKPN